MIIKTKLTTARFFKHLTRLIPKKFSGKLEMQNTSGQLWRLYFDKGCMIWATGGDNSWRRWRRNFTQFCPLVALDSLSFYTHNAYESWQYYIISSLVQHQKISLLQATYIIKSTLIEVLFDLIQQDNLDHLKSISITCNLQGEMKQTIFRLSIYEAFEKVKPIWQNWCEAKLFYCTPNLAPRLKKTEAIKENISALNYQKLKKLISYKLTLRELAFYLKLDLLKLTATLKHYVSQEIIQLSFLPDLPALGVVRIDLLENQIKKSKEKEITSLENARNSSSCSQNKFVVCIDDCPIINQVMGQIITKIGYQFIGIQKSTLVLPTLMGIHPWLIFLDIDMPIFNGYEICSQIRTVPHLKNTPIVILTGRDTIVDRVRAQLAGCSEFINKPINQQRIEAIVNKYLNSKNTNVEISVAESLIPASC